MVSVPLRGKGRDQQALTSKDCSYRSKHKFPSPCGEKVGINLVKDGLVIDFYDCFRPLAGKR